MNTEHSLGSDLGTLGDGVSDRAHFLPVQRHAVVTREHLIDSALDGPPALVVLRGPGGIGKSVTAAQIAHAFVERTPGADAVWVRFSTGQVGVEAVWQCVLSGLLDARVLPANSLAERLSAGGVSSTASAIDALNSRRNPLLVVLDNAQESITTEVESSILEVLENVGSLSLIITTRRPLPILSSQKTKLRIPVLKLTKDALRLNEGEIARLVERRSPDEANVRAVAQNLHSHSQGWPLAVHALLVERSSRPGSETIALDRKPSRPFIKDIVDRILSGSDALTRRILYLIAQYGEVSSGVLAKTLHLPEISCSNLLGEAPFEDVDYWIDDEGTRWYQLHGLVAEELRERASSLVPESERQTYAGRIAQAMRHLRPRVAMQAAIVAEDWDLLSELMLEGNAITLSRRQQPVSLGDIPSHVRAEHPVLAAFALIHEYAFPSGMYGKAVAGFRALTSRSLSVEADKAGFPGLTAAILKMVIGRLTSNETSALAMAELVTAKMQDLSDEERRRYSSPLQVGVNQTVITYLHVGQFSNALTLLDPMRVWSDHLQPKSRSHAAALGAWAAMFDGEIVEAKNFLHECEQLDLPVGWQDSYIGAGYRIAAAMQALEQGDTAHAQAHMDALREHESTIEHWPYLAYIETLIVEYRDGVTAALGYLASRQARKYARTSTTPFMKRMLQTLHARLTWQAGRVLPARKRDARDTGAVYVALSRNDDALALAVVSDLGRSPYVEESPRRHAEVLLLQAIVDLRIGDFAAAKDHASTATSIMNSRGLMLPMRAVPHQTAVALAEHVPELPVAHASRTKIRNTVPLTPSEHRAIAAVVRYGTVGKAADALYLSSETVKSHMKQVYRKLDVKSRHEAIRVASAAGLLTPEQHEPDAP